MSSNILRLVFLIGSKTSAIEKRQIKKYGYYDFGDTIFDGVNLLHQSRLTVVYDNFHSVRLRMQEVAEKGKENLFFQKNPGKEALILTVPVSILDEGGPAEIHKSIMDHPFVQDLLAKKINVVDIFNRNIAYKETADYIKSGNGPDHNP